MIVEPGDLRVFDHIESQTTKAGRRSLLALREVAAVDGPFAYLEIGSHLGGSLQPFVVDQRCTAIISIDPRPLSQPDKSLPEGEHFHYEGNSTARMLGLLASIPGAETGKIRTIEASTMAIDPASIREDPALCFIDGEHTDMAALHDALFCAAVAPNSIVAFHASRVIGTAISAFMRVAGGYGGPLPGDIFAVDLAGRRRLDALLAHPWPWRAANAAGIAGEVAAAMNRSGGSARRARLY